MLKPVCSQCGLETSAYAPCQCGGIAEFVTALPRVDAVGFKRTLRDRRASNDPLMRSGVWRMRELLPPIADAHVVTLNEGNIPLFDSRPGAAYAGVSRLAYLHLGMNPSGSFKDMGMTVAVSAAKAAGARGVICASTGNTASSMAAYAARAGMEAYAVVPRGRISKSKLAQIIDYGAKIVEVDGSFDDAFANVANNSDDLAVVNSINPYRVEGQKCSAFVMLDQRDWKVPDWVVLPGGNLGNASAFGKGFREAFELGLIDRLPRIAVIQAAGAAPFASAWKERRDVVAVDAHTVASAIAIGDPKSWRKANRVLEESRGTALAVDDDAILAAKAQIGREGIGCEPASAASLAGLRALRSLNIVAENADVVAVLTGHALKDTAAILAYHELQAAYGENHVAAV